MSEVPDSISHQELLNRLREACEDRMPLPRSTTLPAIPIHRDGGMLDLTLVVEQITLSADGVSLLQMLHLASHLIDAATRGLDGLVDGHRKSHSFIDQGVAMRAGADLAVLAAVQNLLHPLLAACSEGVGKQRKRELENLGYEGRAMHRRLFVSDALLDSLGMDKAQYDAYFRTCLDAGLREEA
jgi:hypothetical protein